MDIKPGTPEYDEAYSKEMQRLEAEAGKPEGKPEEKPAATTSTTEEKPKVEDQESVTELKARLEKAEKAIKDTQRWGHSNAAEVARLKKEAEDRKRTETRPAILEANPGLEDAIKHVAGTEKQAPDNWLETVTRAVPDVETLLADQDFHAKAAARRAELGPEWEDPIAAIRELSSIRTEHLSQKTAAVAVEAARKDFEKKAGKRSAMSVPGGSGGSTDTKTDDDAVKRYQTMSNEDFDKERRRVMGY